MIKAECVAASIALTKIATFKVTMPRYILAEFNTHRMFTRNSASSRAIPLNKMIKSVQENPFTPIAWQKDHKGMQGTEYLDDLPASQLNPLLSDLYKGKEILNGIWNGTGVERPDGSALYHAIECATELNEFSATKQIANRLLEPFMYHTVLVTATEWENFFNLRCPMYQHYESGRCFKSKKDFRSYFNERYNTNYKDNILEDIFTPLDWLKCNKGQADIHMMAVAEAIYDAWNEAKFKQLRGGEWHIPYGDQMDEEEINRIITEYTELTLQEAKIMISIARCARLSYQTLGNNPIINYKADIDIYYRLKKDGHWSPFEHVAQAMTHNQFNNCSKTIIDSKGDFRQELGWLANFRGWIQQRSLLENTA